MLNLWGVVFINWHIWQMVVSWIFPEKCLISRPVSWRRQEQLKSKKSAPKEVPPKKISSDFGRWWLSLVWNWSDQRIQNIKPLYLNTPGGHTSWNKRSIGNHITPGALKLKVMNHEFQKREALFQYFFVSASVQNLFWMWGQVSKSMMENLPGAITYQPFLAEAIPDFCQLQLCSYGSYRRDWHRCSQCLHQMLGPLLQSFVSLLTSLVSGRVLGLLPVLLVLRTNPPTSES